jgi:hypothetical protein
VPEDPGIDPTTMHAIRSRARELAEGAPPLAPQQILRLRSIFAGQAGGDVS